MVETQAQDGALFPVRVGDRLRAARSKAGLDLTDIANKTRVPLRHLQSIETGDYAGLPSVTYAVGFVKSYARSVGEDETELARDLRLEMGAARPDSLYDSPGFEDADPARIPPRLLAWTAAGLAALVLIGWGVWRSQMSADPAPAQLEAPATETPAAQGAPAQPAAAAPSATGQVTLTATAPVWLRIYDANDKVLFEKEMAAGERFDVPRDANSPKVRTGRAELITVTIDGKQVASLGPPERTIKDVGISAAALAARAPTPGTVAVPLPGQGTTASTAPVANASAPQIP